MYWYRDIQHLRNHGTWPDNVEPDWTKELCEKRQVCSTDSYVIERGLTMEIARLLRQHNHLFNEVNSLRKKIKSLLAEQDPNAEIEYLRLGIQTRDLTILRAQGANTRLKRALTRSEQEYSNMSLELEETQERLRELEQARNVEGPSS